MAASTPSVFAMILLFGAVAVLFIALSLLAGSLLRTHNPYPGKLKAYESGEEPLTPAWHRINVRFYVLAIVFVLFEAEILFLFPWSVVFGNTALRNSDAFGWASLWRMVLFVAILALGLWYAWAHDHLTWIKPRLVPVDTSAALPDALYQERQAALARPGKNVTLTASSADPTPESPGEQV